MKSKKLPLIVLLALLLSGLAACMPYYYPDIPPSVVVAPYPWMPGHGHGARYHYRYFPSDEVYYDPGRNVYFYADGGGWRVSATLPVNISFDLHSYVVLDMDVDRPYLFHKHAVKVYPRGYWQNRKHRKKIKIREKKRPVRDHQEKELERRRRGRGLDAAEVEHRSGRKEVKHKKEVQRGNKKKLLKKKEKYRASDKPRQREDKKDKKRRKKDEYFEDSGGRRGRDAGEKDRKWKDDRRDKKAKKRGRKSWWYDD